MSASAANILVIDDEIGMREGCRRALIPHGFKVSTAEHGVEGLRKLREEPVDLVLLDAMMPGMGGIELLERVQEHDPDIVCVMITGYATVDLAAQAMKQGAHDFLPKPFTSDELLGIVERAWQERERRLAARQQRQRQEEDLQIQRTREDMAKLDAIESRFMLVIAHELRNPAGVIKNYLQLMRAGYVEACEWDEYLTKLDLRATQLLTMLDEILELAHLKEVLNLSKLNPVDVAQILEEVAAKARPRAEAEALQFEVEVGSRPTMLAEPLHLRSLWSHLIDNAINYTPSGKVKVSLTEQDGQMTATVTDTGIGMSNEELTRIFQEFYRSESARAEVELGTGLGLPIVNQIVRIYQGTIDVDSVQSQGSTFTVRLPLVPGDRRP